MQTTTDFPNRRKPTIAALLNLLTPGLGQVYCGRWVRGAAIELIQLLIVIPVIIFVLPRSVMGMFIILNLIYVGILIFSIVDSWVIAKRTSPDYRLTDVNRIPSYFLFIVLITLAYSAPSAVLGVVIREQIQSYRIAGDSMSPTLQKGDRILAQKIDFEIEQVKAGDLIVFNSELNPQYSYIRRVVALAGQSVEIKAGKLLVDNHVISLSAEITGMSEVKNFGPVTVPKHHVFVMGDKRDRINDSRKFGPVSLGSVTGRVASRYWPPQRKGDISEGFRGNLRGFDIW